MFIHKSAAGRLAAQSQSYKQHVAAYAGGKPFEIGLSLLFNKAAGELDRRYAWLEKDSWTVAGWRFYPFAADMASLDDAAAVTALLADIARLEDFLAQSAPSATPWWPWAADVPVPEEQKAIAARAKFYTQQEIERLGLKALVGAQAQYLASPERVRDTRGGTITIPARYVDERTVGKLLADNKAEEDKSKAAQRKEEAVLAVICAAACLLAFGAMVAAQPENKAQPLLPQPPVTHAGPH